MSLTEPAAAAALDRESARIERPLLVGAVVLASLAAFQHLAVTTAMPTVVAALDGQAWYALAFGGALAAAVVGKVLAGLWSDARGPQAPLWAGAAGFVAGLVIAGAAPSMAVLVAGRVLQGLGGGVLFVVLYVAVGRVVVPDRRPRLFAALAAAWVLPAIVGPFLAGLIVEHAGWRWVFLGMAPFVVPAVILVQHALRDTGGAPEPDPASGRSVARQLGWALAAAASVGLLHYGGQLPGLVALAPIGLALVGLIVTAPRLLPAGTLRARRGLPTVILLRGLAGAGFVSAEVFIPLLLGSERGFVPATAGLALTVSALTWSAGSWYQGRPGQPFARTQLLQMGMGCLAVGAAVVALAVAPAVPAALALAGWAVAGLGMGLVYPTLSVLTLELSPAAEHGRHSSALQLWDSLCTAAALAVVGSLFAGLLPHAGALAYLAVFGFAGVLAVLGLALAGRTGPANSSSWP